MRDFLLTLGRYIRLTLRLRLGVAGIALIVIAVIGVGHFSAQADDSRAKAADPKAGAASPVAGPGELNLSDAQLEMVNVGAAEQRSYPLERSAVGSVDFNEERPP